MSSELTPQDVVNHMSNGFQRVEKRLGGLEDRMNSLENRVENLVWRLQRELADFRSEMERRFDGIQEDLLASMEDIGLSKREQGTQDGRLGRLKQHAGFGTRKFRRA